MRWRRHGLAGMRERVAIYGTRAASRGGVHALVSFMVSMMPLGIFLAAVAAIVLRTTSAAPASLHAPAQT